MRLVSRSGPGQSNSTTNKLGDEMVNRNPYGDPLPLPTVGAATAVVLVGMDESETSWHALSWRAARPGGCGDEQWPSSSARQTAAGSPRLPFVGAAPFDCGWVSELEGVITPLRRSRQAATWRPVPPAPSCRASWSPRHHRPRPGPRRSPWSPRRRAGSPLRAAGRRPAR